jgi:4-aminobutyrate aminotransferase-like enzyme
VELKDGARQVQDELLQRGIVVNAIGDTVLRFLPPLTVTLEECRVVVGALREILQAR